MSIEDRCAFSAMLKAWETFPSKLVLLNFWRVGVQNLCSTIFFFAPQNFSFLKILGKKGFEISVSLFFSFFFFFGFEQNFSFKKIEISKKKIKNGNKIRHIYPSKHLKKLLEEQKAQEILKWSELEEGEIYEIVTYEFIDTWNGKSCVITLSDDSRVWSPLALTNRLEKLDMSTLIAYV